MGRARCISVVAVLTFACGESNQATTYGDVTLEVRSAVDDSTTFADTTTMVATIGYGPCLDEFYRDHDEDAFTGDEGKDAVADWRASLCDPEEANDADSAIGCEVAALEQRLGGGITGLLATFSTTEEPGEILDGQLRVGPFPDEDSADCDGGALPGLYVGADALVGRDVDDVVIWTARPIEDSVAVVDQSDPVLVYATRLAPP